jgi:hypothetical protein
MYHFAMAEDPNLDLPELENEEKFPWLGIGLIVLVIAGLAFWIWHGRNPKTTDLQQQLATQKAQLDIEKDKVFDLTRDLDALKARIKAGQVENKDQSVAEYNKLAAEQRAQREKVKQLADEYNKSIEKYRQQ